jgi:hypothetical protein
MGQVRATYERDEKSTQCLVRKPEEKRPRRRGENIIKMKNSTVFRVVTPCTRDKEIKTHKTVNIITNII